MECFDARSDGDCRGHWDKVDAVSTRDRQESSCLQLCLSCSSEVWCELAFSLTFLHLSFFIIHTHKSCHSLPSSLERSFRTMILPFRHICIFVSELMEFVSALGILSFGLNFIVSVTYSSKLLKVVGIFVSLNM